MTATAAHELELTSPRDPTRRKAVFWTWVVIVGAVIVGRQIAIGGSAVRVTVAVVAMIALAIPAFERPKAAVTGLFIALPFLGMIRHMFLSATGAAFLDPLLLLTSSVAVTVLAALLLSKQLDFDGTPTAKVVFLLLVVGIIQVFNPGQGSILVGLTGIMINLIPISFFFIARSISDQQMTARIIKIVMVVGTIAGLYGLSQVFFGFRGFEKTWLASQGYTAAVVGETTRPFSFFNNAAEYAAYVHLAFVAVLAAFLFAPRGSRRVIPLGVVAMLAWAGFLIGSRGFTVKIALAVIVLLAARARNRLLAVGVVVTLSALAVGWAATSTSDSTIEEKEAGASQLIEQQLRALRDPFDRTKSTLPIHWDSATHGVWFALTEQPAGLGTGVATRGGAKFGGIQAGTEFDIGDAFLSFGAPGGFLYVLAILFGIRAASRVRRALPGPIWIAIWAMALTSVGAWLVGGNYSITPLIWYLVGAADGMEKRLRRSHLLESDEVPGAMPA